MAKEMKELWDLLNLLTEKEESGTGSSPKVVETANSEGVKEPPKPKKDLPEEMKRAIDSGRTRAVYFATLYKTLLTLDIPGDVAYDVTLADARK